MRLSIQSKLIIAIVLISITAAIITGILGYRSGESALKQSIYERLTAIRISKARQIENFMTQLNNQVLTYSEDLMIIEATREFRKAAEPLRKKTLAPQESARIVEFYEKSFLPELARHIESKPVLESVYPSNNLALYLQYHYIINNSNPIGSKDKLEMAADGSEYSKVHAKYHEVIDNFRKVFLYDDMLIIDAETSDVIYTASKEIDLGTDFDNGPFSKLKIAEAVRLLQRERDKDRVVIVDYESYRPAFGYPTAFALSPIFDGNEMIGILAVQFPIKQINDIISGSNNWEAEGLGKTGEVILGAEDGYLRNESRFFVEDRKGYIKALKHIGVGSEEIAKTERLETTILTVRLKSEIVRRVLEGEASTMITRDYLGREVLASFAPLDMHGLRWGIVAKIPTEEAFIPIRKFTHDLLTTLAAIGLAAIILATMMGASFTRPIRKLIKAAARLSKGELDTRVRINGHDEFNDLGKAFNEMAAEIQMRKGKLDEKIAENERLLESMLPSAVAARLRTAPGEQQSDTHADVTIVFAEVRGFDTFSESLEPTRALNLLNRLIVSFDEAAERHGVEKLKSIGASYLAVCGLSIQRFDHSQRAVAFALDVEKIVQGFNRDQSASLVVNIGVHRGPVTGGIIGRSKFIYDLWGRTINYARSLSVSDSTGAVQISEEVYDRVAGIYSCELKPQKDASDLKVYLLAGQGAGRDRSIPSPASAGQV